MSSFGLAVNRCCRQEDDTRAEVHYVNRVALGRQAETVGAYLRKRGIHIKRDTPLSIAYSEELISFAMSATLQSTDRHHEIVGQEHSHFQLDS